MHKRAGATTNGTNGVTTTTNGGSSMNGGIPPIPVTKQRRRKKRKQKPSHVVEEWLAVILGVLIVLGCGYWAMTKLWEASLYLGGRGGDDASGGGDDSDPDHKHNGHHHREGKSPMAKMKPMDFNSIYHIPEAHTLVGDRSDKYAKLRKEYDLEILPKDYARSLQFVKGIREQQAANEYEVVPIVEYQSHGSLHQGHSHEHRRRHGQRNRQEEEREEEEEEKEEEKLMKDEVYDIYNCPDEPVDGYPYAWPIMTVLDNWSPDDTTVPDAIYQGLCVFDYQKDHDKAMTYRNKEVPFIVQNDPEVARTVERWNSPGYMDEMLKGVKHRTEFSHNNHFMYALPPKKNGKKNRGRLFNKTPKDYVPPTEMMRMPYREWLEHANITVEDKKSNDGNGDDQNGDDDVAAPGKDHWYFRLIGCGLTGQDGSCDKGSSEYLFDELPFFQPVNNLYLSNGAQQKGIHCRFGMKGVIAENHFDGSRNAIALLGGSRRYILAHPDQCDALQLYPPGHPSARHSQVDYTNPDLEEFPDFAKANANEVIMQPGDVLYLPTNWFHYIVSLELNFQCNTRSGIGYEYEQPITECGF